MVHPSYHFGNSFLNYALGGWEWSGKIFWRSGLPFSIIDGNTSGGVPNNTFAPTLGYPIAPGNAPGQMSCGEGAASANGTATPCLNSAAFIDSASADFSTYPGFSPQRRNQYVGPHFFDMDMALFKTFKIGERVQFGVGAQAYNVFNHPNFSNPDNYLGDSTFGHDQHYAEHADEPLWVLPGIRLVAARGADLGQDYLLTSSLLLYFAATPPGVAFFSG